MSAEASERRERPALQVLTPHATPEEVAAIVAVLGAVGGAVAAGRRPTPSWAARHRGVRQVQPHGPGGWRASGLAR